MQETHYNDMEIRTITAGGLVFDRAGVGIQILIDGTVYTDGDNYYVNIDSFSKRSASSPR